MILEDFEKSIIQIINDTSKKLVESQIRSDADWTCAIFTALTEYAYDLNLRVWTKRNLIDPTLTGCLYDFMVCEGQTPIDIDKIWLVLESEWSQKFDEIKYDFYKLVQSRSVLRVMIFQSRNVDATINHLIKILETSQMSIIGDRYLFAGWSDPLFECRDIEINQ